MNNKQKGDFGELLATNYLIKNKYSIISRNYRVSFGEIDIIAKSYDTIIFVEVKARSSTYYGYPSEALSIKKQEKIIETSKVFIQEFNLENLNIRFDVIEVYLKTKEINHIENAFLDLT
ncbi:MAG: YraN family protein [Peptostreptococcaceae bacterium]